MKGGVNMKLSEILEADWRIKQNRDIGMQKLAELPFFKSEWEDAEITIEALEEAIRKMFKKYPIIIGWISRSPVDNQYYSFMIKNLEIERYIKTISCQTIYEGFAKTVIFMYAYIKNNFPTDYKWRI